MRGSFLNLDACPTGPRTPSLHASNGRVSYGGSAARSYTPAPSGLPWRLKAHPESAPTLTGDELASSLLSKVKSLQAKIGQLRQESNVIKQSLRRTEEKQPSKRLLDLVFVAAEVAPWSKTGGLGDVMSGLPKAMAARGHRVMVVTPRYLHLTNSSPQQYEGVQHLPPRIKIDMYHGQVHEVEFYHLHRDHVDWVFVDHMAYHRPGTPYGNGYGPYDDNPMRFALLCMSACEAALHLDIGGFRHGAGSGAGPYGQDVVFIANDWHAGLLPAYLQARYQTHGTFSNSRCVVALHNIAFQGSYTPAYFHSLGLPGQWYRVLEWIRADDPCRTTTINILKGAVVGADHLVTVSQNYAWEISYSDAGQGLSQLLQQRADHLTGIVNGIDADEWDPAKDPHLPACYSHSDLKGKAVCKFELQRELGLPQDADMVLVGFIGRLDYQKGPDLVLKSLPSLINMNCQVVMLGSGAADYEAGMVQAEQDFPYHVRTRVGFDVPLSHRIFAGCDILLMPSRFEPCGLNQLYAMRYGTVPIAHSIGGLRDTIDDFNPFYTESLNGCGDIGTGWTFAPATVEAMLDAVSTAVKLFREQPCMWQAVQQQGMLRDFSWGRAAAQYEAVFQQVMALPLTIRG